MQSLFILNSIGEIIIEKHYRGLLARSICDYFWEEVTKSSSVDEVLPVIQTSKYYYIHVQRNGLFFVSICSMDTSPLLVIEYLHRICDIFGQYFEKLSEESLKKNFLLVYQLLDEMMDNGLPFSTEPNSLMEMIPPPNVLRSIRTTITGESSMSGLIPEGNLTNTPWRKTGVRHTNNEIYFDIIEDVDCVIEINGLILSIEVSGEVQCNCQLSGMPDLSLHFNNPHILDDVSFHPCVRYNRFEQSKVVSFVPPDGQFKLMNYRVKGQLQLPFFVKPQITWNNQGGKFTVIVGTKGVIGKPIEDFVVSIPFSKSVESVTMTGNCGFMLFDDVTKVLKWKINKIPSNKSPQLEGTISMQHGTSPPESNPTLSIDFKVNMWSISGLKVESLALHNERYKPFKGVRFVTKAGKFIIRS
jgi:AP-3 complex subunit mu